MQNYGRHDPESGLPLRVLDFLKSLDTIVDAAIAERVDLVIFAGDAYRDRAPAPTFQREWGRRIIRLSQAKIPTLLLVGNHDLAPAAGKAPAIQEFDTLDVPYVRVLASPGLLKPDDLWGLPLQVIAWPWLSRSAIIARRGLSSADTAETNRQITEIMIEETNAWLDEADASLPIVMTAHASVEGAVYGSERTVIRPAGRRKLDRVLHEVAEDPLQGLRVGAHDDRHRRPARFERDNYVRNGENGQQLCVP